MTQNLTPEQQQMLAQIRGNTIERAPRSEIVVIEGGLEVEVREMNFDQKLKMFDTTDFEPVPEKKSRPGEAPKEDAQEELVDEALEAEKQDPRFEYMNKQDIPILMVIGCTYLVGTDIKVYTRADLPRLKAAYGEWFTNLSAAASRVNSSEASRAATHAEEPEGKPQVESSDSKGVPETPVG